MALSELYSDKILDIAGNALQPGRLPAPDASARKVSRICGSVIEVDIVVTDGVITGYGHEVSACALGQTSAAIVAREIVGTRADDFLALALQMRDMLKAEGTPPDGKWADLAYLEPVREFPARHASTLLVFDAVADAIGKAVLEQATKAVS
ncbi:nitrogen fixation protein NifU [Devosia sp. Root685]|uniref:iron-sulfur cluster assembly scaffold protein n=1 Tax=Devosia sp. Root685 TaxID=1736587 RepID=UPI0006FF2DA5|nr:iron-sulfur cluster assembly scaffold protein [Devosia sp. Root685]KRA99351.1 nitrogen fixation protein NifU [Devosia sp. Root685]